MRKVLSAFLIAFILTAAGCGSNNAQETSSSTKHVEQVLGNDQTDTSEMAISWLREEVPLFVDYLGIRRKAPITVESSSTLYDGSILKSGIYIKDNTTAALTSETSDGSCKRVVYVNNTAYQIEDSEKIIYYFEMTPDRSKEVIESYLLNIDIADVLNYTFEKDTAELNGINYNHERIIDPNGFKSDYYFDINTNQIRFMQTIDSFVEFERLENKVTDESLFELPEDYEMIPYEVLLQKEIEEDEKAAAQTSEQTTVQPAEQTEQSAAE